MSFPSLFDMGRRLPCQSKRKLALAAQLGSIQAGNQPQNNFLQRCGILKKLAAVLTVQARSVLSALHVRGMPAGLGANERLHALNTMVSICAALQLMPAEPCPDHCIMARSACESTPSMHRLLTVSVS